MSFLDHTHDSNHLPVASGELTLGDRRLLEIGAARYNLGEPHTQQPRPETHQQVAKAAITQADAEQILVPEVNAPVDAPDSVDAWSAVANAEALPINVAQEGMYSAEETAGPLQ